MEPTPSATVRALTRALVVERGRSPQATPAEAAAASALRSPQYRATHRLDPADPAAPPVYALREADILLAAADRDAPATISVSNKEGAWLPWRAWP